MRIEDMVIGYYYTNGPITGEYLRYDGTYATIDIVDSHLSTLVTTSKLSDYRPHPYYNTELYRTLNCEK